MDDRQPILDSDEDVAADCPLRQLRSDSLVHYRRRKPALLRLVQHVASEGANLSCRQRNARSPIRGISGRYLTGRTTSIISSQLRSPTKPAARPTGSRPTSPVVETIRRPSKWMLIARLRTHRPLRDRRLLARQSSSSFLNEACARANQAAQSTIELRIQRYRRGGPSPCDALRRT